MTRNNTVRWFVALFLLILAGYYIYPTVRLAMLDPDQKATMEEDGSLKELKSRSLKLGLDLQGGMYLQLEVDLIRLMENLAKQKDATFESIRDDIASQMHITEDFFSLFAAKFADQGISLNRYFGDPGQTDAEIMTYIREQSEDAINRSLEILRNRIDQFGLSEPTIMKRGQRRIVIELPGVNDPDRAKALIGKTAQLEFTLVAEQEIVNNTFTSINDVLKGEKLAVTEDTVNVAPDETVAKQTEESTEPTQTVAEKVDTLEDESPLAQLQDESEPVADLTQSVDEPFLQYFSSVAGNYAVQTDNIPKVKKILEQEDVQKVIPPDDKFLWGKNDDVGSDGLNYAQLYLVKKEASLTGNYLKNAYADVDQGYTSGRVGQAVVSFMLDKKGARTFARVTADNINRRLAIVLDDRVYMAPNIRSRIPNGSGVIEGMESMESAKDLAIILRAGALPAPVKVIEERTVGPSLGRDSIKAGTTSALVGLIVVLVFMIIYYKLAGVISVVALLLNLLFLVAILSGFHATLTLPGIAGIILTIGMAVDANVLVFERIREERRSNKTVRASIESGFDRAFTTILDANITTLIAGVVLYQFGTGPIKGFALTLMIGIIASMYTAVILSHLFFDSLYAKKESSDNISI